MINIFFAEEELKYAKEALKLFSADKEFMPTSKFWPEFLIHLELCYIKAERGLQDVRDQFQPFQGYYTNLRRKDPLLSYLKNSRDAVMHDLAVLVELEIVDRKKIVHIDTLWQLDKEGNKIREIKVPLYPARIKLKSFNINGRKWDPPRIHLNKPLKYDREPLEVADLAIKFYEGFLTSIKQKFIS